jgi:HNH endonuclease
MSAPPIHARLARLARALERMSTHPNLLIAERLREVLSYDPETGIFTRVKQTSNRIRVGDIAGSLNNTGYLLIRVDGIKYSAHRLAFLFMLGRWPDAEVDHINLIRSDNRWSNLREATHAENKRNSWVSRRNTSGFKGVNKRGNRWYARIRADGDQIHLGYFATPKEAHAAYCRAAAKYHGKFARVA